MSRSLSYVRAPHRKYGRISALGVLTAAIFAIAAGQSVPRHVSASVLTNPCCAENTREDAQTTEPGYYIHAWLIQYGGDCQDYQYQAGQDSRAYSNGPFKNVSIMEQHVQAWAQGSEWWNQSFLNYTTAYQDVWTSIHNPGGWPCSSPAQQSGYQQVTGQWYWSFTNYIQ